MLLGGNPCDSNGGGGPIEVAGRTSDESEEAISDVDSGKIDLQIMNDQMLLTHSLEGVNEVSIMITDIAGNVILDQTVPLANGRQTQVELPQYHSFGIYFAQVQAGSQMISHKFVR